MIALTLLASTKRGNRKVQYVFTPDSIHLMVAKKHSFQRVELNQRRLCVGTRKRAKQRATCVTRNDTRLRDDDEAETNAVAGNSDAASG